MFCAEFKMGGRRRESYVAEQSVGLRTLVRTTRWTVENEDRSKGPKRKKKERETKGRQSSALCAEEMSTPQTS
jgi:hypothetical protein